MKRAVAAAMLLSLVAPTLQGAGSVARSKQAAVASPDRIATSIALQVLTDRGSAADAAVAASFVLAVTAPHRTGLGGGGFLVYYEKASDSYWALDFREASPRTLPDDVTKSAGASAGVPGFVAGLGALHQKFGKRPWGELIAPASALASSTPIGRGLRAMIESEQARLQLPERAAVFGASSDPATPLNQHALSQTLQQIATRGAAEFYSGSIAKRTVKRAREKGGALTLRDFLDYKARWRSPVRIEAGDLTFVAPAPPSAGAAVVGQAFAMARRLVAAGATIDEPAIIHLLTESCRRAYIDQANAIGDPDKSRFAFPELFAAQHIDGLVKSIDSQRATPTSTIAQDVNAESEEQGAHLVVVDAAGNIVSISTSLGAVFGSGILTDDGFFINAAMRAFASAKPATANSLEAAKRPKSFLTPLIVLRGGKPFLAIGSDGGPATSTTLLQVLMRLALGGNSITESVAAPRFHQAAIPDEILLEAELATPERLSALSNAGHPVRSCSPIGDVQAIHIAQDGLLTAVSDHRREGVAGGF